jgi:hypothetical protein
MFAEADIFLLCVSTLPIPNLVPRLADGVSSKFLNTALGIMESIVTPYVNPDLRKKHCTRLLQIKRRMQYFSISCDREICGTYKWRFVLQL